MDIIRNLEELEAHFTAREPQVMAFLPEDGRFERLRREAEQLLARFPDPKIRPGLFGIVVGVKDIFHVSGFVTRAGSRLPAELLQGEEAESVSRLKRAGALILGKTVTTEFAYFAPGPTRNPHRPGHTPGGSSSGSAAAVGAGLCGLALGTQTIGSIIRPAAFCGVVGVKPSYERISREGVIPLSPSLDHVGFFTIDADKARRAAAYLCQDWQKETHPPDKPVLGIPDGPYLDCTSEEGQFHFQDTCRRLENSGYEIRRVTAFRDFSEICARNKMIVAAEAAQVHAAWFEEYADLYASKTAELVRRGQAVSEVELALAREGRIRLRAELTALMDKHEIDLWICPPAPGSAPESLASTGDPVLNLPWTHAGLPAVHLPAGRNRDGLPMGLQVVGRYYTDENLLAWAEELERVIGEEEGGK